MRCFLNVLFEIRSIRVTSLNNRGNLNGVSRIMILKLLEKIRCWHGKSAEKRVAVKARWARGITKQRVKDENGERKKNPVAKTEPAPRTEQRAIRQLGRSLMVFFPTGCTVFHALFQLLLLLLSFLDRTMPHVSLSFSSDSRRKRVFRARTQ